MHGLSERYHTFLLDWDTSREDIQRRGPRRLQQSVPGLHMSSVDAGPKRRRSQDSIMPVVIDIHDRDEVTANLQRRVPKHRGEGVI